MSFKRRVVSALALACVLISAGLIAPGPAQALTAYPGDPGDLYLSMAQRTTLPRIGGGTVTADNEDVVYFHASENAYEIVFDGSDVGLSSAVIDALANAGPSNQAGAGMYLSFTSARTVAGVHGTVDDSDVVIFLPTKLGADTAGRFEPAIDGSTFGLKSDGEDIDALAEIDDEFLISTTGNFSVTAKNGTFTGQDEDIVQCSDRACTNVYRVVDLTAGGLSAPSEDVDALAITGQKGHPLYLSTTGDFSAPGVVKGANEDIFICGARGLPDDPDETCRPPGVNFNEYFDGGDHGITGNVTALEYAFPPGTE